MLILDVSALEPATRSRNQNRYSKALRFGTWSSVLRGLPSLFTIAKSGQLFVRSPPEYYLASLACGHVSRNNSSYSTLIDVPFNLCSGSHAR